MFQEICNRPVFVSDSTSQFDISPGKMGECGFLRIGGFVATIGIIVVRTVENRVGKRTINIAGSNNRRWRWLVLFSFPTSRQTPAIFFLGTADTVVIFFFFWKSCVLTFTRSIHLCVYKRTTWRGIRKATAGTHRERESGPCLISDGVRENVWYVIFFFRFFNCRSRRPFPLFVYSGPHIF